MKNKLVTLAGITSALMISMSLSTAVMAQTASTISDKDFDRMYADMDTNKDGLISRAEYMNYHSTRFDGWDTTRKGMLTREQIKAKQFEREMKKTDGEAQGNTPAASSVQKR